MHAAVAKEFYHSKAGLGSDLGAVRKMKAERAFDVAKKLLTDHLPESTRQNESQFGAYEEMAVVLGSALGRAINMLGQGSKDRRRYLGNRVQSVFGFPGVIEAKNRCDAVSFY